MCSGKGIVNSISIEKCEASSARTTAAKVEIGPPVFVMAPWSNKGVSGHAADVRICERAYLHLVDESASRRDIIF